MPEKQKDRHLDVPSEANRDKHVNFIAQENEDTDPASESSSGKMAERTNNQKEKGKEPKHKTGQAGKGANNER
ncbi:MAG TPA: hypothetical protein VGI82_10805 [Chitinophagaceae bacterium]|jgi:hypothetical protein